MTSQACRADLEKLEGGQELPGPVGAAEDVPPFQAGRELGGLVGFAAQLDHGLAEGATYEL